MEEGASRGRERLDQPGLQYEYVAGGRCPAQLGPPPEVTDEGRPKQLDRPRLDDIEMVQPVEISKDPAEGHGVGGVLLARLSGNLNSMPARRLFTRSRLAAVDLQSGEAALELSTQSLAVFRNMPSPRGQADECWCLVVQARVYKALGRSAEASSYCARPKSSLWPSLGARTTWAASWTIRGRMFADRQVGALGSCSEFPRR